MQGYQQKRKHQPGPDYQREEVVDDLAFAASFAIVTSPDVGKPPEVPPTSTNEIKNSDEKDISTFNETTPMSLVKRHDKNETETDEESSDDESDVDLSEQLAKMEKEDTDTVPKKNNRIVVPTTQNEIDLYNCSIADLEKRLDIDLDIHGGEDSTAMIFERSESSGILNAKVAWDGFRIAGNIKFHMVSERTIVVESDPMGGSFNAHGNATFNRPLLLDEGSNLFLKVTRDDEFLKKIADGITFEGNEVCVIPLGKILEVFGPVAKPIYTVRLKGIINSTTLAGIGTEKKEKVTSIISTKEEVSQDEENMIENSKNGAAIEVVKQENAVDEGKNPINAKDNVANIKGESATITNTITKIPDPWSQDGLLTQWITTKPRLEVFYTQNQIKVVDTQTVVRNSGKGCDASNIYDEEVSDTKEMYFSDDEQERMAKKGKKKKNKINSNKNDVRSDRRQQNLPSSGWNNQNSGNGQARGHNSIPQPQQHMQFYQQPPIQYQQQQQQQQPFYGGAHQQVAHQQNISNAYTQPVPNTYPGYAPPPPQGIQTSGVQSYNQIPPPPPPPPANASGVYYPGAPTNTIPPPPPPRAYYNAAYPHASNTSQYQQTPVHSHTPQNQQQPSQNSNADDTDTVYYNYSG